MAKYLTDEEFNVLERYNFIINPNINNDEWDLAVLNEILDKYREKSIKFYNDTNFSTLYCRKFGLWNGLNDENFGFNWDAIKEDILSRIEII